MGESRSNEQNGRKGMGMIDVTFCGGCHCMTHSIIKGRAHSVCGKCGQDKSLGDYQQGLKGKELNGQSKA